MASMMVTVSSKGQIVIPAQIRQAWGIEAGQKLAFVDMGNRISLVKVPDDPIAHAVGLLKDSPFGTKELVEERKREEARRGEKLERWTR
jgi:AbrB family looped-hinge helix DNA binding protein